jgi:hypothetical protein
MLFCLNTVNILACEVLTTVVIKSNVYWDIHWNVTDISEARISSNFRVEEADPEQNSCACHPILRWFITRLILGPWRYWRHVVPKRLLTFKTDYAILLYWTYYLISDILTLICLLRDYAANLMSFRSQLLALADVFLLSAFSGDIELRRSIQVNRRFRITCCFNIYKPLRRPTGNRNE